MDGEGSGWSRLRRDHIPISTSTNEYAWHLKQYPRPQGTASNAANRMGSLLGDGTDGTVEQLEQQIPILFPTFSHQENLFDDSAVPSVPLAVYV